MTQRLLAIDTSTQRTSVGVGVAGVCLALEHGEGGAPASATLLPTIDRLLTQQGWTLADLDAVVFGQGPGAFTGLRTATAVVQGLAYGVRTERHPDGLPVVPVNTLWAVAEDARHRHRPADNQPLTVLAVLDARMDEVYTECVHFPDGTAQGIRSLGGPWLTTPALLPGVLSDHAVWTTAGGTGTALCAGNAQALLEPVWHQSGLHPTASPLVAVEAWPTAEALLRLAPGFLADGRWGRAADAQPLYVRDKVALTTAERTLR